MLLKDDEFFMCAKFWFSAIIYVKVKANTHFTQVNALVPGLNPLSPNSD